MKTITGPARAWCLASVAAASLSAAGGCSSVIGSAYLRDAWLDAVEHAAESAAEAAPPDHAGDRGPVSAEMAAGEIEPDDGAQQSAAGDQRGRYATLDDAMADADRRLGPVGGLTPAARQTLTAMLEPMPPQDWGVVVTEFAAALVAAGPSPAVERRPDAAAEPAPPSLQEPQASVVPVPPSPVEHSPAPNAAATEVAAAATGQPPAAAASVPEQPVPPAALPAATPPTLAVQNACFATRVRAWGAVDRFESARFTPGQEVIVYFELDQLATRESDDGHTSRVATVLKLVDADGRRLHEWTFEPLEETCRARRRDYFARYVLTLPEGVAAGPSRLEISVTDAVAGSTAQATLPLDMLAR
jgi:hypothetical protein